jgi:NAD-dependent protein deacetylase/lipoamidase
MFKTENISTVAAWLHHAQHIVAFTGAGISTPSGIPDFRSSESGMWTNVDQMKVASIYGFRHNPQAFYDWVRPLTQLTLDARPNPAHLALLNLEQLDKLDAIITQNIDMLHTRAGNKTVYELHGHMREATCINCFHIYDGMVILEKFLEDGKVPHCVECNGVIKPNVILFGEQLPIVELQNAKKVARNSDLMLVIGSSLEVAPASDIPVIAKQNGAKIVIVNLEPTSMDSMADRVIYGDAAEILPAIVQSLEQIT